ncbi:MAG TPA: hypothetical protein V6C64_14260 [Microcoleaceae cyanobacterium]
MTESGSSPEPKQSGLKVTLMQGVIGAVTLAGTTAIPLLVTRYLSPPPTPTTSPSAQAAPAQVTPAPTASTPVSTTASPPQLIPATTQPMQALPTASPPPLQPVLPQPIQENAVDVRQELRQEIVKEKAKKKHKD